MVEITERQCSARKVNSTHITVQNLKTISQDQFKKLCSDGTPIDNQGAYPCVVIHPDHTVTKIWAIKKGLFSSATLSPYPSRFVRNASLLHKRGVTAPEILNYAKVADSHIRIVTYQALLGTSIRDLLKNNPEQVDITKLSRFIHELHEKGILFRSLHFGNIIQLDEGGYGLIDFTDVKFFRRPLPLLRRAANIAFALRYGKDAERIKQAGLPDLKASYMALLEASEADKMQFEQTFKSYIKR
jgi:hypothetical protein